MGPAPVEGFVVKVGTPEDTATEVKGENLSKLNYLLLWARIRVLNVFIYYEVLEFGAWPLRQLEVTLEATFLGLELFFVLFFFTLPALLGGVFFQFVSCSTLPYIATKLEGR